MGDPLGSPRVAPIFPYPHFGGEPLRHWVDAGDSLMGVEKGKLSGLLLNHRTKWKLKSNPEVAWGKLHSRCSKNPHVVIDRPGFTIGQCRQCDLMVRDPRVGNHCVI